MTLADLWDLPIQKVSKYNISIQVTREERIAYFAKAMPAPSSPLPDTFTASGEPLQCHLAALDRS